MEKREHFSSRLGFILISAGCAIGLGNVWRFPYIVGQYGGAAFVLIYILFLVILGMPIMAMEFAVGRASQKSAARSFHVLEPKGTKWHIAGWSAMAGNYILMMFYTTVGGWMLAYIYKTITGEFEGLDAEGVGNVFNSMLGNAGEMMTWMLIIVIIGFAVCAIGLQKGVEKITKAMMLALLGIMIVLCINSILLDNSSEGLKFYLVPDFGKMLDYGIWNVVYAAMSQAFFTLSLGIGAMAIFGSYISRDRSLMGESINICILDTCVAFMAGLIIFPACFSFGVNPGEGPGLVFVTLPNIFNQMAGGKIWGTLFFLFMTFAALSTIIAVFENTVSFMIDLKGWSRKKSVIFNGILITVLSIPCVLGFNVWSGFAPFGGTSTIQDLEDFIVSSNLLPLGSLAYLLFCVSKHGWGWENFIKEVDAGKGIKFPKWAKGYLKYVLPIIVIIIFVMGYYSKFFA
ncbi:MAG: sodium-dependent transporter [Anaeromassilibacillus sp.]|nr:sodium-dependent transporter [Anaeromassilibacillus sp.]MDY3778943.1 sodium-dependent transporter [Candidatus Limousia pullorum]